LRVRDDDRRSDELLAEHGRIAARLGLAVAWTSGIRGELAKTARDNGPAGWKAATVLVDPEYAAGLFQRCRTRNPLCAARASNLVLLELDAGDKLLDELGIELPRTVRARSRRGRHRYYRPAEGCPPAKVQISADGVTFSSDGYLVLPPALHPQPGVMYAFEDASEIAVLPAETYERLRVLGEETRTGVARLFELGGTIAEGQRRETIFHIALDLAHDGLGEAEIMPSALAVAGRCDPPLDEGQVRAQVRGAVKRARIKPRDPELVDLAREADKLLDDYLKEARRAEDATDDEDPRGEDTAADDDGKSRAEEDARRRELFLPFERVALTGPPKWLWRGKVPQKAVTLLCGRPKLGKSLLTIWLVAQLSRGLLEGDYRDAPARALLIAAEDPADTIVKPRLIAAAADQALVGMLAVQDHQGHQDRPRAGVDGLDGLDQAGTYARRITIPDEYRLLEQIIVENEIALLVLDPINSFISHKVDAHRDAEIRRVLDPLAALAARRSFAAVAVVHLNRRSDTDILNRITGSAGYGGSARSILTFGRHPENDAQRVVAAEGNWQKEAQSDLFELREIVVFPDVDPEDQTQPALVHIGTSDLASSDLIDPDDDRSALEEAKDFLLGELAFGAVPVADLRRGAEANGLSWPTLERAKKLLGVQARRISVAGGTRGSGRWEWFLELAEEEPQE
jgi:hypothetical protein